MKAEDKKEKDMNAVHPSSLQTDDEWDDGALLQTPRVPESTEVHGVREDETGRAASSRRHATLVPSTMTTIGAHSSNAGRPVSATWQAGDEQSICGSMTSTNAPGSSLPTEESK